MSNTTTAPQFVPAQLGRHHVTIAGRVVGRIDALPTGKLIVELLRGGDVEIVGFFVEYEDAAEGARRALAAR